MNVLTVVGARPQFIKAAPISHALRDAGHSEILVHTGQHFDQSMSNVFFDELDIPKPAYNLDVNSLGHGAMTGRMLEKLESVMLAEKPDIVVIYGDTNSTVAGALAAAKLNIPVAHVEAGLRSFNRKMPEEINRVVADHLSEVLLCPTSTAVRNLANEGVTAGVYQTGDVMFDATLLALKQARLRSQVLDRLKLEPRSYSVATVHRAENTNDVIRFASIARWLERASKDLPIIFPVHPRTRHVIERHGFPLDGISMIEPLGFLDMTWLVHHAQNVFTDSGGLQKEAYFHRVPCVTLREETEWVETVEAGWNRLWAGPEYRPRVEIGEYGDGRSAVRTGKILSDRVAR